MSYANTCPHIDTVTFEFKKQARVGPISLILVSMHFSRKVLGRLLQIKEKARVKSIAMSMLQLSPFSTPSQMSSSFSSSSTMFQVKRW